MFFSLSSAVDRIPAEIFGEIFASGFSEEERHGVSPIVVSHVCRKWRDCVHAERRIWTNLILSQSVFNATDPLISLEKAKLWMSCSGVLPLNVHIRMPADDNLDHVLPTLSFLASNMARIKSLHLTTPNSASTTAAVYPFTSSGAPILGELTIKQLEVDDRPPIAYTAIDSFFESSPVLRKFSCYNFSPAPQASILRTITHLNFTSKSSRDQVAGCVLTMIQGCPALECLTFEEIPRLGTFWDPPLVTAPYLHTIDITFPGAGGDILLFLKAPRLSNLRLNERPLSSTFAYDDHGSIAFMILRVFFRKSQPTLKILNLFWVRILEMEFVLLLEQCPEVEELTLDFSNVPTSAFLAAKDRNLLPALRKLHLKDCMIDGLVLIDFIRSMDQDALLHFELTVEQCSGINRDHLQQLSMLVKLTNSE